MYSAGASGSVGGSASKGGAGLTLVCGAVLAFLCSAALDFIFRAVFVSDTFAVLMKSLDFCEAEFAALAAVFAVTCVMIFVFCQVLAKAAVENFAERMVIATVFCFVFFATVPA